MCIKYYEVLPQVAGPLLLAISLMYWVGFFPASQGHEHLHTRFTVSTAHVHLSFSTCLLQAWKYLYLLKGAVP
jgi:hypothetical protein